MKKSVLIVIFVIYIASIFFIGLFGMKIELVQEKLYVSKIHITNETCEQYTVSYNENEDITYITFFYNPDYEGDWQDGNNPNTIILSYRVEPADATNKGVTYAYDKNPETGENKYGEVDTTGLGIFVRFKRAGTITVTLLPLDGSNVSAKVSVVARRAR